jgi:hypothetical protein
VVSLFYRLQRAARHRWTKRGIELRKVSSAALVKTTREGCARTRQTSSRDSGITRLRQRSADRTNRHGTVRRSSRRTMQTLPASVICNSRHREKLHVVPVECIFPGFHPRTCLGGRYTQRPSPHAVSRAEQCPRALEAHPDPSVDRATLMADGCRPARQHSVRRSSAADLWIRRTQHDAIRC